MPEDEITDQMIGEMLTAHFTAAGGKDRTATFAILEHVTGERSANRVDPSDYDKLARALLKATARLKYGIK